MKKQLSALFLALVLCLGLCTPALAATTGTYEDGNVTISGDFAPNEDVFVTIKDKEGTLVNIGAGTADADGKFTWTGSAGGVPEEDVRFDIAGTENGRPADIDEAGNEPIKPAEPQKPGGDDKPGPEQPQPEQPTTPDRPIIPNYPNYVIGGGSDESGKKPDNTPSYSITVPSNVAHGTVSVLWPTAAWGDMVTVSAVPDAGYELDTLTVKDKDGNELTVTSRGINKYTFVMPKGDVTIQASFKEAEAGRTVTVLPATIPFTDVAPGSWYYDAVRFVYGKGMMNGTTPTAFSPNATTSRGMIVTILYRLEGEPAAGSASFTDVPSGQWYSAAVAWAAQNGIVDGYGNGTFGPNESITREQMAAILYRYASYKGYSVTASSSISDYSDAPQVSSYAQTAMSWANATGLITGTTATTLAPKGSATRAQAAMILMRFCEVVVR